MTDLERSLGDLGRLLEFPPTPEIGQDVSARVRGRRPARAPARRTLAVALCAFLLVAAGAVAAVPAARHTVLDWLGLRSVHIERVPRLPAPPPGVAPANLDLGTRTTLAGARARVHFRLLVPVTPPGSVYVGSSPAGGRVTFVYGSPARPRMLITEFRGDQPRQFIDKTLAPGTTAQFVRVDGEPGVWIAGRPHEIVYRDARGRILPDTLRLAGNTLVWRHGAVLVRLEADVSRAKALEIARTMR